MMDWEKKPTANKTWANACTYFKEIVAEQEQHQKLSGRLSKQAKYKSMVMARERAMDRTLAKREEEQSADM